MSIRTKIITAILSLSLVAVMVPSGVVQAALTEAQIQSILSLLTSFGADTTTVANVEASLRGTTPTTPTTPTTITGIPAGFQFTQWLAAGAVDQEVVYLKIVLAAEGCVSGLSNTTYFGSQTKAGVQCFQQKYGTGSLGTTGPNTRAKLNTIIAGGVVTPVTPVVPTGAGLTVALSADNPAAGTLVSGSAATDAQGGADIAHFTFTNGDNAEVKVTSLNLKRMGVSVDALLNNVYLYDGVNRLTDGASVSSGIINFNDSTGLFTVPAGSSKTIRVLVDLVYGNSGQTVGVQLVDATGVTTNASSVKGTFPISGNLFTTASATLATVDFSSTTTPSATAGTTDPMNDYTAWQNITSIGARAVTLRRFALRQTGSALAADVQNYRLLIDGTQVGSAVAQPDANGYITFDLSASPVRIETGHRTIKVLGDIIGGSSKTVIYSLRASADAAFTDTQVGVDVVPTYNSATAFAQRITGTTTINSGTATFTKTSDSPTGNIVLSAPNAVLAKFQVKAAGEPVKISDLYVTIIDSTAGVTYFRNGALYANGVQIGSTTDIAEGSSTGTHFSLGSSLIVNPGSPVTLEIRSDIKEKSGTTAVADSQTIYARIIAGSSNAEGRVSKTTISTPSANTDGNTLTVKTGALTLAKYTAYTNQSVVAPLTAYKLAHFTLAANTTESVNITGITATLNGVSSYATNLYATFGTQTATVKPTVTATNTWSVNYTLAAGQTVDVKVYADVSSSMTSGPGIASMYVDGTTVGSATSVCADSGTCTVGSESALAGQTLTFTTGSITPTFASTPLAAAVAGNQKVLAARYKFTAANDSFTVTELKFYVGASSLQGTSYIVANSGNISSAVVQDGSTAVSTTNTFDNTTTYANDTVYFQGMNVSVPANTTKYLDLYLNLAVPDATNYTSQLDDKITLGYVKALNSQGAIKQTSDSTISITTAAANVLKVFKTIPTFTVNSLPNTTAANGTQAYIYSFNVAAGLQGDVALKQLKFTLLASDGGTTTSPAVNTFKFYRGLAGGDITTSVTILDASGNSLESTTYSISSGDGSTTFTVMFDSEDIITKGTSQIYKISALLNNFYTSQTGNDSISTSLSADTVSNITSNASYCAGGNCQYIYGGAATTIQYLAQDTSGTAAYTPYVIWSDMSAVDHDDTYNSGSRDWINGYLIENLPLDTKTVTAL